MAADHSLPAWLRLPLLLLPAHVREEHATEIRRWLETEHGTARRRGGGSVRLGAWLVLDVLRAAPRAHWDVLRQDLTSAGKQLRRSPGFSAVAIATLAVGMGANALLFSLVDGVLFRPLPYQGADRLVEITESNPAEGRTAFGISPANFQDLIRDTEAFSAVAAYQGRSGTVLIDGLPERVVHAAVTGEFFRVFTEAPVLGRTLGPGDDFPGGTSVVLSYNLWRRAFGADQDVIGATLTMDGAALTVVGVMPETFVFETAELWTPLGLPPDERHGRRGARYLRGVGRLAPEWSAASAGGVLAGRARTLAADFPETNDGWIAEVRPLAAAYVGEAGTPILLIWAASALVLLIAVANVANLLLGRALARGPEIVLRGALGARTGRIARQLFTEGLVLAGLGAALGLGLARLALAPLQELGAGSIPRLEEVTLGPRVVAFSVLLVLLAGLLASTLPALTAGRLRLWAAFGPNRGQGGGGRQRWQGVLVAGQVALAVFVLIASVLVVRTLRRLIDQPLGFDATEAVTFRIEPAWPEIDGPIDTLLARLAIERERAAAGYRLMEAALGQIPGVRAVGAVNRMPLTGGYWVTTVDIVNRPAVRPQDRPAVFVRIVTPGYLDAIGTRIIAGRGLLESDVAGAERAVVIDESFARRHFPDRSPLGEELLLDGPPGPAPRGRIVGVAESVRMQRPDEDPGPTMYQAFAQAIEGHYLNWGMDVVVRGAGPSATDAIRSAARESFPAAAVFRVATLERLVASSLAGRRFQLLILGVFGSVALILATTGVGAVLLLGVRQESREIGIRLALGERPAGVFWRIQRRGLMLVGAGLLAGVGAAVAGAGLFAALVHGVSVRDPVALAGAPLLLLAAAFLAGAWPAARAMRLDPIRILRDG